MGWFTKTVEVEKVVEVEKEVVKYLLGTPEPISVFEAYEEVPYVTSVMCGSYNKLLGYYKTCAEAFASHPGSRVKERRVWRVGDTYISNLEVQPIIITKKPKREKGKAKA